MNDTARWAVVTGGTDGIGRATAERLALRGYHVVIVARNAEKGERAAGELNAKAASNAVTFWQADLSLMREAERLAARLRAELPRLDVLIYCAGVMLRRRTLTAEGIETVFAVQYLSRYLLTGRVIDLLERDSGKLVNVSAGGSIPMPLDFDNLNGEKFYHGVIALMHESVANDMLILDVNERYPHVCAYCYGPGYVRTTLMRDMPAWLRFFSATGGRLISITPERAADQIMTLITMPHPNGLHGRLIEFARKVHHNKPRGFRADARNRQRLREVSDRLIAGAKP